MADKLELLTLNVRGIQTMSKRRDYLEWLKDYNQNIIFLQETHTCALDEQYFRNTWGPGLFYSHGSTNARGVITIIPTKYVDNCKIQYRDLDGRLLIIELKINETTYYLINIYAPSCNNENEKLNFLTKLKKEITPLKDTNLILGGDWNIVLDPDVDKKGGNELEKHKHNKYRKSLLELIEEFDLNDCWRQHHPNKRQYTWRRKNPRIFCRLDMWIISSKPIKYYFPL
jgi:exonuclease III